MRVTQVKQMDRRLPQGKMLPVNHEAEGTFCIISPSSLIGNKGQRTFGIIESGLKEQLVTEMGL